MRIEKEVKKINILNKKFLNKIKKYENKKTDIEEKNNFLRGAINFQDEIAPSYINLKNPKYLEIDNLFYGGLIVVNYYREQNELLLKNLLETNINMNISMFYEKQDQYKTIKELTYHIGNVGVEIQDNNPNRQDIDLAIYTYNDAKYIRKEMQVNNEDLYFLYIYIEIFANNIKDLE